MGSEKTCGVCVVRRTCPCTHYMCYTTSSTPDMHSLNGTTDWPFFRVVGNASRRVRRLRRSRTARRLGRFPHPAWRSPPPLCAAAPDTTRFTSSSAATSAPALGLWSTQFAVPSPSLPGRLHRFFIQAHSSWTESAVKRASMN